MRLRWVVSDPAVTRRLTAPFAALFAPVVVALVLTAFAAISTWVLFTKGLGSATHQAFDQPLLLLLVFAITVFSAGFHEFGHASACRYGGATPGAMGTGLYLVWPAFYTDVTDSYRLGRGGRLRVDLGGLYFNAIVAVAMFGVWAATRWDALLLILATQLLQMVRQLAPMVRFDGYHVLADLTGVPDLYARMGPTLRSLLPGRGDDPRATALKPWARAVVTAWVLVIVPLLLFTLVLMVLALPRVLATAWGSLGNQAHALTVDWAGGDVAGVAVRLLAIVAISLPVLGVVAHPGPAGPEHHRLRVAGDQGQARATSGGRPGGRCPGGGPGMGLVARRRPVPAHPGLRAWRGHGRARGVGRPRSPGGTGRSSTQHARCGPRRRRRRPAPPRARARPGPQGRCTRRHDSGPPAWVFPFNRPGAPGAGDNQALAVNTTDGSSVYDVAFAMVWADGSSVTNRNEAYAFASCASCRTVAVAFQVVLIVGQADVASPRTSRGRSTTPAPGVSPMRWPSSSS